MQEGAGDEWTGVEWSGVEWSMEWSGVEYGVEYGVEWSGVWSGVEWRRHVPMAKMLTFSWRSCSAGVVTESPDWPSVMTMATRGTPAEVGRACTQTQTQTQTCEHTDEEHGRWKM